MSIIVILEDKADNADMVAVLEAEGYVLKVFPYLPTLIHVMNTTLETFTLSDDPRIKGISDAEKELFKPMYVDRPITNISWERPYEGDHTDSWALPSITRRKNPFTQSPIPPRNSFFRQTRTGKGVDIYVIDQGIVLTDPEFADRTVPFTNIDGTNTPSEIWIRTHGGSCASCALGSTLGVATQARGWYGNLPSGAAINFIAAYNEVLDHYNNRANPDQPAIMTNSWGGVHSEAQLLEPDIILQGTLVTAMIDAGIVCCYPAGNEKENHDLVHYFPAEMDDDAIIVGGVSAGGTPMWADNYGTGGGKVSVYAPADKVKVALRSDYLGIDNLYSSSAGTSFATPYAAGVIACMLEGYKRLTGRAQVQIVKQKLIDNATTGVLSQPATFPLNFNTDKYLYLDPNIDIEEITGLTKI